MKHGAGMKARKRFPVPPVLKLLVRGYIIIGFLLALEFTGVFTSIGIIIFLVTVTSISMVFGIGYLLVMASRPVRANSFGIPGTVLFFVKGSMMLYFVSLLAQFGILPGPITSLLIVIIAGILMLVGVLSYVYEVIQRARPLPRRRAVCRPGARPGTR